MADDKILNFPIITRDGSANETLEHAKGWNFEQVFIVGYVENHGTPEGTIIQTTMPSKLKTIKNQLFMAELLRYMALKGTGLI